jgi:hypothetical protein
MIKLVSYKLNWLLNIVKLFPGYYYFQISVNMLKLVSFTQLSWHMNMVNLFPEYNYFQSSAYRIHG